MMSSCNSEPRFPFLLLSPPISHLMSQPQYYLAQLNIAFMKGESSEDPIMADFVANIGRINAIAESDPAFVWRLVDEGSDPTNPFTDPRMLANLSVWQSIDALKQFVYKSDHVNIMRRKKEWFHLMEAMHMVLWYVPAGHIPTLAEAKERLELLRSNGPTADAFHFGKVFEMPVVG